MKPADTAARSITRRQSDRVSGWSRWCRALVDHIESADHRDRRHRPTGAVSRLLWHWERARPMIGTAILRVS
jgi:hypothetical protein